MLWGRLYAIWDPSLAQASLKARNLSFEPFVIDFAEKSFDLRGDVLLKATKDPRVVPAFTEAIHSNMQPKHVHAMNVKALSGISKIFDEIKPGENEGLDVENMFDWLKDFITIATTDALLGPHSPFAKDPSLYDDLW